MFESQRQEEAPRKQPDDMQRQKQGQWNCIVIRRIALADVTQQVLVHEVEPEEPAPLTGTRRAAHQASRISQTSRYVPGNSNRQKQQRAAEEFEMKNPASLSDNQQIDDDDNRGECGADQPFSQHPQRREDVHAVNVTRAFRLGEGSKEAVQTYRDE